MFTKCIEIEFRHFLLFILLFLFCVEFPLKISTLDEESRIGETSLSEIRQYFKTIVIRIQKNRWIFREAEIKIFNF